MELKNPIAIYTGIPIIVILALLGFGFIKSKKKGKKVANTEYIEQTSYYRWKFIEFRVCKVLLVVTLVIGLSGLMGLLARPSRVYKHTTEIHNRDIMLCLDTSGSMFEVDLQVCEKLKEFVKNLKGERFGITIFNCQTATLVPLTTDYDYILQSLDDVVEACKVAMGLDTGYLNSEALAKYQYMIDGTLTDAYGSGSSLIGDGLASTIFQFPDLDTDKDRTRVIILSTDNELYGDPFATLGEASDLCRAYDIKVFGAAPEYVADYDDYKNACEKTGGALYTMTSPTMVDDLVAALKKTDTSVLYKTDVTVTEFPEKLVILFSIAMCAYFIVSRRLRV